MKQLSDLSLDSLKLIYFDEIDSTNDYLKRNYDNLPNFTVVTSKYQTNGRGQFERKWLSNSDENLLFSILLKDIDISLIDDIRLVVINSLLDLLIKNNIKSRFKEPNDIYYENKKLCGILIETLTITHKYEYVIIGIGLNVNQIIFNDDLEAISMFGISNKKYQVNSLLKEYLTIFKRFLSTTK
ncbi:biotin--[acetyl-CoA-carboxylase] ligase [Haploplasma axanthum]|uniref:Bifunctional protein BirA n=1 Tax=Haploplasma axanthum TaxID=29552 RepID=A0A449BEX0_HAPAX|nr:biotin--[acetyl-CoA-carboxylase] ligase [Haploplasma axanthum]VEU80975.1 Bifunctional protein BirA [Haploplasma axanthum]